MIGMESSLLPLEQQKEMGREDRLLIEQPVAEVGVPEQTEYGTDEQSVASDQIGKWAAPLRANGYYPCERLFKALIPFKYRSETSKKEIVVWASDRQDADELYVELAGSSLCSPT